MDDPLDDDDAFDPPPAVLEALVEFCVGAARWYRAHDWRRCDCTWPTSQRCGNARPSAACACPCHVAFDEPS